MTLRLTRVLFLIGACALLLSASAQAEDTAGINITVYNNYGYNAAPPLPGDDRIIGTMVGTQIDNNFDQEPLFNIYEDFVVKYEGFITAPCTCAIQFMAQADDGTKLYLDGALITNDWRDKGGGGSVSQPVQFEEGLSKQITLWFYENGGGAWVQLWWMVQNQWEIVPASAFTTLGLLPTTTLPPTTTTEPPQTTTTTSSTTTTTEVPTTTTTTELTIPPTLPPTTTVPQTIAPTTTTVPPTTTSSSTTTSTTTSTTSTTVPVTTTTIVIPPVVSPEEATELATNPEVLAEVTAEEATEIFEALVVEDLSEEQLVALVSAVQDAPVAVRESFEASVNVFGGGVDTYVPIGSTVPVKTRRALIVINLMSSVAAMPIKRK